MLESKEMGDYYLYTGPGRPGREGNIIEENGG
jgi:hypothetical protein